MNVLNLGRPSSGPWDALKPELIPEAAVASPAAPPTRHVLVQLLPPSKSEFRWGRSP